MVKTKFKKALLSAFYLNPDKVPENIAKRPYVILLVSALVGLGAVRLIVDAVDTGHDLTSLIYGLLGFAVSVSGLYLWVSIRRRKGG